jgi:hypothetical protein
MIHGAPEKFETALKERLTFPHVGVLRALTNLEKGILFLPEKKGTLPPEKDGGLPDIYKIPLHLSA